MAAATAKFASRLESSDAAGRRRSRSATDMPRTVFQQVVAQNSIVREPAGERALESIDVVNAFADERTLAEKVLIYI
jgi:hypothetical protein